MSLAPWFCQVTLWTCMALLLFAYVGYPLVIWCCSQLFGRVKVVPAAPERYLPSLSLLIVAHNEEAAIEEHDARLRKQLLTFVVAGGGFSGVEVVAELNDFVRRVARNYPQIDPAEIRVVLVHSQGRILPEVGEKLGLFAQRILRERGVELLLDAKLAAASGEEAILADGRRIGTRTLVSTVPSFPHPVIDAVKLPKARGGRVQVTCELGL